MLLQRPLRWHGEPRRAQPSGPGASELEAVADSALDLLQQWQDWHRSGMSQPDPLLLLATEYALQRGRR